MAFIHGKSGFVSLDGDDLSAFATNIELPRSADSHDLTTFGKNARVKGGGLKDGTCTIDGKYDDGATGPQAIIDPLIGTVVELVYQPEGVGTGKPTKTVDVLVQEYTETVPVADYISWSVKLEMSDDLVVTTQA